MAESPGPGRLSDEAVEQRLRAVDELLATVEQYPGPTSDAALEAVQALVESYGEALARVVDSASTELVQHWCDDELLGHLMVLHGIHPEPVDRRVQRALDEVTARLGSGAGELRLLGIEDGTARVQISGSGCHSPTEGVDEAVHATVLALVPELAAVAGVREQAGGSTTLIPVEALLSRQGVRSQ